MPAFQRLLIYLGAFSLTGLGACSSTDSALETDRAPSEIRTDADRQAAYNRGLGTGNSVPDATPGRVPQVREQAAASGGRQRIESVNTNAPNNTTQEERMLRIQGNATLATDTLPRP
ncbi:hypothetical protein [Solirubrum puertoriconensis]|uniref:Lipoprotein n=1 Tax=Solirubrum puertoriconensis TaxID=1751427 RepID=A0A9X0L659_SOLP1|nr:hypothetical protein [Solirubrum puertoriconensis]KUG09473.1 hypothetical protein ASU33_17285 [Solirubrum puertoriconensis]